ncbi:zf-HC2 domain-containing protein [Streptomyces sp. NPDC002889]|uniref:zf-HC2 domain-containing protein n=1 Tax=Streptomyces sp. NPDC002889 TaxID=3364669 RepID=UPI0036B46ADD
MNDWHVSERLAAQYANGSASEPDAWSLEKHVECCTACATRVSAAASAGPAAPLLAEVRASVLATAAVSEPSRRSVRIRLWGWRPSSAAGDSRSGRRASVPAESAGPREHLPGSPGLGAARAEEPARAVGDVRGQAAPDGVTPRPGAPAGLAARATVTRRPGAPLAGPAAGAIGLHGPEGAGRGRPLGWVARAVWAAGPALHRAWLVALGLVVAAAFGLAYVAGLGDVQPALLLIAPVVPLAGVGLSYGRHADPLYEVAASTPAGGLRLLLTRAAAVLAVSIPLLTAAGALLPAAADGPGAAAWLLPGLALTLAALALGSYVGCEVAAGALALGWMVLVVAPVLASLPLDIAARLAAYVDGPAVQGAWAAGAVLCAGLLALRRSSFDHLEKM